MPRKRTGRLIWTEEFGYRARVTVNEPGASKPRRKVVALQDEFLGDRALANRLLRDWVASHDQGPPKGPRGPETLNEFATEWIQRRRDRGLPTAENEWRYYQRIWRPAIGKVRLRAVTRPQLQDVIDRIAAGELTRKDGKPYSRQSLIHARSTIFRVLQAAWKAELVQENKAARTELPDNEYTIKPRVVLTDDEIRALVQCPDVDAEIQVLVIFARNVAGLRSGDLMAATWEGFSPGFETYTFTRRKTRKKRPLPETHAVPEAARLYLETWHDVHGKPKSGPVFPARRGKNKGKAKKLKQSFAQRLRRELVKAGVTRHEVHAETDTTLPVDFHSCRRSYSTALARAGVNEQQAMQLTGHASSAVHARYVAAQQIKTLPDAAVLVLPAPSAPVERPQPKPAALVRVVRSVPNAKRQPSVFDYFFRVGVAGFEPATAGTQSRPSTRLRYTPKGVSF